jgi:hypothetical protein
METDTVGWTYVEEIAVGRSIFSEIPCSSRFDLNAVVKALTEARVFIKTAIELALIFREQSAKPTVKQLYEAIAAERVVSSGLTEEKERALLEEIIAVTFGGQFVPQLT